jgi:hypothetical protein
MKQIRVILLLMALLLATVAGVQAQEQLEPGVAAEGTISNETTENTYTYDAAAGEVVVLQLFPVDILADYDEPMIVIQDDSGAEIMRRESFGETTAVWEFAEEGTYTIIASRADEDSVGDYTLTLISPQELAMGDVIEGTTDSDTQVYFVYRADEDFILYFARDGEFAPEVTVNSIDTDITPGSLDVTGVMGGGSLTEGAIGIFDGGETHIIKLGEALFDFNFGTSETDYLLEIIAPSE